MNGGTKTTKKRVSKKTSESHDRDAMRGIVEDILRSMADDKVPAKVPRKETLMKRTEMNNLRDSIKQLETNVSVQFTQVDQKLNTLKVSNILLAFMVLFLVIYNNMLHDI